MKMIIFLVLAGLSLAAGKTDPGSRWQCLFIGLETAPKTLQELAKFICKYRGKFDGNVENYKNAFNELKKTLIHFGCEVNGILGTAATIEDIGGDAAKAAEHAGSVVLRLTDGLGLTPKLTDVLCKLTSGALSSDCLKNILASRTPDLIKKLYDLTCKDISDLSAYNIFLVLQQLGCFVGDALGTKDKVEELFAKLGYALAPTVNGFLDILADDIDDEVSGKTVVSDNICRVLKILSGQVRIFGAGSVLNGRG
ncbi:ranaspumin-like isoform X1 [Dendrobates tinctorius]|uniref:ranaspumin-like isoform X1 n=1 Tax=Dendrobates tinctorius TaxID=92724 RepID=UPI003CCA2A39